MAALLNHVWCRSNWATEDVT